MVVLKQPSPRRTRPGVARSLAACCRLCLVAALAGLVSLAAADPGWSPAASHSEFEIKSAMLYNFTKFIDWPDGTLAEGASPLVIGVWKDEAFGPLLEASLRNKTVYGHPVVVRRIDALTESKGCHVLFIGAGDRKQTAALLSALGQWPVLTIGDGAQFANLGGVIAFIRDGSRMGFEINLDAAAQARLKVSSKLLHLATIRRDAAARRRD